MRLSGCESVVFVAERRLRSVTDPNQKLSESVNRLIEHLEGIDEAYGVREHNGTVDFTIGDPELWPRYSNDDHIRAISSSSVDFDSLIPGEKGVASQSNPQMGQNIHLPPSTADLWDELESEAEFSEKFALVNGTFQLGSLLPPPDGVCTPHLMLVDDAEVEEVIEAVDEAFRLYETVYENGERVIKENP